MRQCRDDLALSDQFILARTDRRLVALVVDAVGDIRELTEETLVMAEDGLPGAKYIHGLVKLNNELVLICDLDQFLSLDDDRELMATMAEETPKTLLMAGLRNGDVM